MWCDILILSGNQRDWVRPFSVIESEYSFDSLSENCALLLFDEFNPMSVYHFTDPIIKKKIDLFRILHVSKFKSDNTLW